MPHIKFSAELKNIETANNFLHEKLQNEKPALLPMMELAIEEVLVNVINYAYKNLEKGEIEFGIRRVRLDNNPYYCIWIRDWGNPFDPFEEAKEPDLELGIDERPIGGLGIHLVKSVSTHQCYSADDRTNIVEMFFNANDNS